jgi:ComF family protein
VQREKRDRHCVPLRSLASLLAPPVCAGCGGHAGAAEPLCAACRLELRWLDRAVEIAGLTVFAPVAYEGPARAMVHALKFRGATLAAGTMAAQIAAAAPAGVLARGVLVPVPLHPRRLRRRGFNQAGLLASALGDRTGLRVADCLRRDGSARTQVGRDRAERLTGVQDAIAVRARSLLPRQAIVVDDVVTTGATLAACGDALRAAGVAAVAGVAYARTPGR